jgi:hypothetical protein
MTGDDIVSEIVSELATYGESVLDNVQLGATQASSEAYLSAVISTLRLMESGVALLGATELSDDAEGALMDLRAEINALSEAADAAMAGPADQRKAKLEAMEDGAGALNDSAANLATTAGASSGAPIPASGGVEEAKAYTVTVSINSNPSKSSELWIYGAASSTTPGTKPTDNPNATTAPGQRTATPRGTATVGNPAGAGAVTTTQPGSGAATVRVPAGVATATALARLQQSAQPGVPLPTADPLLEPLLDPAPTDGLQLEPVMATQDPQSAAIATWTLPPPRAAATQAVDEGLNARADGDGRGSPNLMVLALGLAVVGAMAVWLKQRM